MPDFNQEAPPEVVTNPPAKLTPKGAEYPKHLYLYGEGKDGKDSVIVAWDGDKAIRNRIVTVANADEAESMIAEGYADKPVLKKKG